MCAFRMKYPIESRYLSGPSQRRPMTPIGRVLFMVAHDTGNPGSTAAGNVSYYQDSRNTMSASAHTFIDDKRIIECIPLVTGKPEKAWHVVYDVPEDNRRFGYDANDAAGAVELCHGGAINLREAYARYVWYMAYACYHFRLDPAVSIAGHYQLDPARRTDPTLPLKQLGKTFDDFVRDVVNEYHSNLEEDEEDMALREEFELLRQRVEQLERRESMAEVPEWARAAVDAAVAAGLIDSPNGRSFDFYSVLTVLHRKGVL
jgi:N-acetylmuramoyl-L-alanine amidase